jgi:hypothetical protein
MYKRLILIFLVALFDVQSLYAAVGCTLNDPDRDIKRLFPEATNYKTDFITIAERGGKDLAKKIEAKLGDKLEPTYESLDVPYAFYTVLKGKDVIGHVHGVNQKGTYGGMQIILATDPNGVIMDCYYQKITSPESKKFIDKKFTSQFIGLTLADFYQHDMSEKIKDPSEKNHEDYLATLRGIKKNLILHDEFMLKNKYDEFFVYPDRKENKDEKQNQNQ